MLGRKDFSRDEIDHAKADVDRQLAAYRELVDASGNATDDPKVAAAFEEFEPQFVNGLLLALDRYFVHRIRAVSGKDGNALNELELVVESLLDSDGVLTGNKVIKYVPSASVLGLEIGERIQLSVDQFDTFVQAFFTELEARFLASG